MKYKINSGEEIEIHINDWVDVLPNLLLKDDISGYSYRVKELYENSILIEAKTQDAEKAEIVLSTEYVLSNFRRVKP